MQVVVTGLKSKNLELVVMMETQTGSEEEGLQEAAIIFLKTMSHIRKHIVKYLSRQHAL